MSPLVFALPQAHVQPLEVLFVCVTPLLLRNHFQIGRSFCWRLAHLFLEGLTNGSCLLSSAVPGNDAFLFVSIHEDVEFVLKGSDLGVFWFGDPLGEKQFVAVDIEEGYRLAKIFFGVGLTNVAEFGHFLHFARLLEVFVFLALVPLLLKNHLLFSKTRRLQSLGLLVAGFQHVHRDDFSLFDFGSSAGVVGASHVEQFFFNFVERLLLLDEFEHELQLLELIF